MRQFTLDTRFQGKTVFKTPFRNDVARVYLRPDHRVIVQCGGTFRPLAVSGDTSLTAVLSLASDTLDNWNSHIN